MEQRVERGSPDRFGYEWATYRTILPEHERQLSRWMGSTGLASFAGKRVLDVGCGMGRNPFFMLQNGAAHVTALDVDEGSLAAARENLGANPRAEVREGSAYDLDPASLGTFDRVTCIGVLHHLAEPERALERMWRCVRPGGDLVLWCYAREGNELVLPLIQAFRLAGSRLPIEATHAIARVTSTLAWPFLTRLPFAPTTTRTSGRSAGATSSRSSSTRCSRTSRTTGRAPIWSASPRPSAASSSSNSSRAIAGTRGSSSQHEPAREQDVRRCWSRALARLAIVEDADPRECAWSLRRRRRIAAPPGS